MKQELRFETLRRMGREIDAQNGVERRVNDINDGMPYLYGAELPPEFLHSPSMRQPRRVIITGERNAERRDCNENH